MRIFMLLIAVFLLACNRSNRYEIGSVDGYAPVYASALASKTTSVEASRPTTNPGKIYAYNQYLFQVDQGSGIHIIDNSNVQQPEKIAFLNIPFCSEISIKSNMLYTNNINDLVVFDISNIQNPQMVKRLEDVFDDSGQYFPPVDNAYFECVDPSKGIVVGWERKIIENPKCRR
jgi:LVIVD repeat